MVTAWNHPEKTALKICEKGGTMLLSSVHTPKHFGITSTNQVCQASWNPQLNPNDHMWVSLV